jgi:hypothetical protein
MRSFLSLSLLLLSVSTFAQTPAQSAEIVNQENAFWTAYASGSTTDLQKLLLPDFTNVEEEMWSRDQVLAFVKAFSAHCTLAPVRVTEPHVFFLTPEIATIVYHAVETPTCGGRTIGGETNISTVWLHRDGRWQMHLHTEYAVPPK